MDNAVVLGVEETSPRVERLAEDMAVLVDSVLSSDRAPEGADDRAELERTKVAIGAAVVSFEALLVSTRLNAAAGALAGAGRAGDIESARGAASALAAASREYLDRTEGPTEGWPEGLRRNVGAQREKAKAFLATSSDWLTTPPEHPRQVAALLKLAEVRLDLVDSRQQIDTYRRGVRKGSFRGRAVSLFALGLAFAARETLERAARSYAREAAHPPRSAALSERARSEREAALASFVSSKKHRQAARVALDAPVGRPWIAGLVQFLFGWAIIGAALAADYFVFAAFDQNYFRWYLANGALIAIVFGFVSLAVRLDDYPDLVSSNPLRYLSPARRSSFTSFWPGTRWLQSTPSGQPVSCSRSSSTSSCLSSRGSAWRSRSSAGCSSSLPSSTFPTRCSARRHETRSGIRIDRGTPPSPTRRFQRRPKGAAPATRSAT